MIGGTWLRGGEEMAGESSPLTAVRGRSRRPLIAATALFAVLAAGGCAADSADTEEQGGREMSGAESSRPPEVPQDADFAEERRAVAEEMWSAGRTGFAPDVASPRYTMVSEEDEGATPDGWRVLLFQSTLDPSLGVFAALGPGGEAFVLTGDADAHTRFAEVSGLTVDSPDLAVETAAFFLEYTRRSQDPVVVLRAPSDAVLDPSDDEARKEAEKRVEDSVDPPEAEPAGDGFAVTLYVQRGDRLDRWTGTVRRDGAVEGEFSAVFGDLPVSYVRH